MKKSNVQGEWLLKPVVFEVISIMCCVLYTLFMSSNKYQHDIYSTFVIKKT